VARLVQLSILDALLSTVAQKDYAAAQGNLGRTTAASGWSDFQTRSGYKGE
jgi:DNA-binding MurR/RpiR family transcriptional regulator